MFQPVLEKHFELKYVTFHLGNLVVSTCIVLYDIKGKSDSFGEDKQKLPRWKVHYQQKKDLILTNYYNKA